jgi:hypothetical protein
LGLKYEKDFGDVIAKLAPGRVLHGQWFHFVDANGPGYCQPDHIVVLPDEVVIFECKLTECEQGRSQLRELYFPVVERWAYRPARGIVVTRHLTKETELDLVTDDLGLALQLRAGVIATLHWRERTPLVWPTHHKIREAVPLTGRRALA